MDSKIDFDFAYLFKPSLRLRYKYLDDSYETSITPEDIQAGVLLEGPLKPEVEKAIQKVIKSMSKPKTNLYTLFNIILLLSLFSMNFLYFDKLESTLGLAMALGSFVYMIVVYFMSKLGPKKIEVLSKTQLIKMNDTLDFKKAIKIKKANGRKKRLPLVLAVFGFVIALALVMDVYLNIVNLI